MNKMLFSASLALATNLALAADMGSGTVTVAEPEIGYTSDTNLGVNPSPDADTPICMDPLLPCDSYSFVVSMPDDIVEYFPGAQVRILVSWDGVDDYDIYLRNSDGDIIADSVSSGGPESITLLVDPGEASFGLEVVYYQALGSAYDASVTLNLGEPASGKTEEDIEAWLAANGAGADARSENTPAACNGEPLTVLTDASGDNGIIVLPIPGTDLQELKIFQTTDDQGTELIGLTLKVDSLESLIPQSQYFVSFNPPVGTPRGVRMDVDQFGTPSFFSYVVGPDSDDEREGHFVESAKPAHPMSNYNSDGTITIYAEPKEFLVYSDADILSGFNAGTVVFLGASGIGGSLNADTMPDGLTRQGSWQFASAEHCAEHAAQEQQTASRSLLSPRGGAVGLMLLGLGSLMGLRRRRYA